MTGGPVGHMILATRLLTEVTVKLVSLPVGRCRGADDEEKQPTFARLIQAYNLQ